MQQCIDSAPPGEGLILSVRWGFMGIYVLIQTKVYGYPPELSRYLGHPGEFTITTILGLLDLEQ